MSMKCPQCTGQLKKVFRSMSSPLNEDQFDAGKAGDFYCDACPPNGRGNSNYCYFWLREVLHTCDHEDFAANVDVHRLIDSGRFQADVRIQCKECGKPFRFIGLVMIQWNWQASISPAGLTYARGSRGNGTRTKVERIWMHRLILPGNHEVRHRDDDGLNNRRCNLVAAERGQIIRVKRKQQGKTSKYKGVHWDKARGKWLAQIQDNGHKFLGRFDDERDAARAYDEAAEKFGEFARLNGV